MKQKLQAALGGFGIVLFYIIFASYAAFPLIFLRFPYWINFLLIAFMLIFRQLGGICNTVLYIWAIVVVIRAPINGWGIALFVIFGVNFIIYLLPTIIPIIQNLQIKLEERK